MSEDDFTEEDAKAGEESYKESLKTSEAYGRLCDQMGWKKPVEQNRFKVDQYFDNVLRFWDQIPFFYDKNLLFWMWNDNEKKYVLTSELDLQNLLDAEFNCFGDTITMRIKTNYIECFKRIGRANVPRDPPKSWVQFKDKIFCYETKRIFPATPEYFICNPIPWTISTKSDTPILDKYLKEWVGDKYIVTLKEILAYCCLTGYPIHRIFCFVGTGRNGKSVFQRVLTKFIGDDNCCSSELDQLADSRFESAKLYKKLVCSMGETNYGVLKKTSMLKKLSGGDLIGFEFKNKNPFDAYNTAKIVISTNSLPASDDSSDGWYRRWLIVNFPNEFPEGPDILDNIPDEEYEALTNQVLDIIPRLITNCTFTNEGSIEDRGKAYVLASNPLLQFIEVFCEVDLDGFCLYSDAYSAYQIYLKNHKMRGVSKRNFSSFLSKEGFTTRHSTHNVGEELVNGSFIYGFKLPDDWRVKVHEIK